MLRRMLLLAAMVVAPLLSAGLASAQTSSKPIKLPAPSITAINGQTVHWSAVANASGYRIRWIAPDGTKKSRKVANSVTQLEIKKNWMQSGLTYQVQARALGDKVNTKNSKWSVSANISAPKALAQPSLSNISGTSGKTVSWNAVTGATSYRVRWIAPDGTKKSRKVANSVTQFEIKKKWMQSGVTYNVQVRAHGDGVNYEEKGPWSGAVQIQG